MCTRGRCLYNERTANLEILFHAKRSVFHHSVAIHSQLDILYIIPHYVVVKMSLLLVLLFFREKASAQPVQHTSSSSSSTSQHLSRSHTTTNFTADAVRHHVSLLSFRAPGADGARLETPDAGSSLARAAVALFCLFYFIFLLHILQATMLRRICKLTTTFLYCSGCWC